MILAYELEDGARGTHTLRVTLPNPAPPLATNMVAGRSGRITIWCRRPVAPSPARISVGPNEDHRFTTRAERGDSSASIARRAPFETTRVREHSVRGSRIRRRSGSSTIVTRWGPASAAHARRACSLVPAAMSTLPEVTISALAIATTTTSVTGTDPVFRISTSRTTRVSFSGLSDRNSIRPSTREELVRTKKPFKVRHRRPPHRDG